MVVLIKRDALILNVNSVGYEVFLPLNHLSTIKLGQKCQLYIHMHVKEDNISLYGFEKNEDLELFELLLTVSGIGPKSALSIINYGVEKVRQAITQAEVNFFTQIPRLGTKNAQKIIIELKNKLGAIKDLDLKLDTRNIELIDALTSMGFSKPEIGQVIKNLPAETKVLEEQVRFALKMLAKK